MPAVFLTNQRDETFAMCEMCSIQAPHGEGEWQCWQCEQWYYSYKSCGSHQTTPVYDRVMTPEQMTQQYQCLIDEARHFLEAQGQRYTIDFGWRDVLVKAAALGYVRS